MGFIFPRFSEYKNIKHDTCCVVYMMKKLKINIIPCVLHQFGRRENGFAFINSCMGSLWMEQDGGRVREMLKFWYCMSILMVCCWNGTSASVACNFKTEVGICEENSRIRPTYVPSLKIICESMQELTQGCCSWTSGTSLLHCQKLKPKK